MSDNLIEIYNALNEAEAYFVRDLLNEAGLEARVVNDNLGWAGETFPSASTQPKVLVRSVDRVRALAVVNDFDRHAFRQAHGIEGEEAEADMPTVVAKIRKPPCEKCGAPRLGVCSYCNASSFEFIEQEEDFDPEHPGGEVAELICPVCGEPTVPKWADKCEQCDHPFPPVKG